MSLSYLATTTLSTTSLNPHRSTEAQPFMLTVSRHVAFTSCEQKQSNEESPVIDRRNVLLGLGGLYSAATTFGKQNMEANGAPVQPPKLSKCHTAFDGATQEQVNCCPPYSTAKVIDFVPPPSHEPLRVRQPAHKLEAEYVEKFKEGIARMKALPADDPWNFMQQATIHCTYCNGAYDQVGFNEEVPLQVHGSWLFLPWHRYYLYFYERIIGRLIGDPTFALPFWNWDTQEGMRIPKIYLDTSSPLYNDLRNKSHYTALFDYKFAFGDPNPSPPQEEEVITHNLHMLRNMFKESEKSPSLFMGKPVVAGQAVPSNASGSLENLHNAVHMWTGPSKSPYHDMGNFYTAARDIMFFGHHANVDKMWDIYNSSKGHTPEFKQDDWLEASFVFYDENRQVVKCKVKDCLTPQQLRYSYQAEKLPWMSIRRHYFRLRAAKKKKTRESASDTTVSDFGSEPRPLNEPTQVLVQRTKISRSKDDKDEATEVLVIDGIEVPHGVAARFDVYVAKPIDGHVGTDMGELAGSFVKIPHSHHKFHIKSHKSSLELGITTLLEDIEAEGSEKLVVTILPRIGEVTIGGVHIELMTVDE